MPTYIYYARNMEVFQAMFNFNLRINVATVDLTNLITNKSIFFNAISIFSKLSTFLWQPINILPLLYVQIFIISVLPVYELYGLTLGNLYMFSISCFQSSFSKSCYCQHRNIIWLLSRDLHSRYLMTVHPLVKIS